SLPNEHRLGAPFWGSAFSFACRICVDFLIQRATNPNVDAEQTRDAYSCDEITEVVCRYGADAPFVTEPDKPAGGSEDPDQTQIALCLLTHADFLLAARSNCWHGDHCAH